MDKNILIIDDDIDLCYLIKKYLEIENYDLIVLDMMLPNTF